MRRIVLFLSALAVATAAVPAADSGVPHVGVQRNGGIYSLSASLDTTLSQCAAWRYLTDYEAAVKLPGVISSVARRESKDRVMVERTAEEHILFLRVHLHSVMEFTEFPTTRLAFTQLSGDSRSFRGEWTIEPGTHGSTLHFKGDWEPDTLLPLFIIDHFAEHDLERRFGEIARLAEAQKLEHTAGCPQ